MMASDMGELHKKILLHYAEKGTLCDLGWTAFQAGLSVEGVEMDKEKYELCRDAFYMGIQHVFSSIVQVIALDEDKEPGPNDFMILSSINSELEVFLREFLTKHKAFASRVKMEPTKAS